MKPLGFIRILFIVSFTVEFDKSIHIEEIRLTDIFWKNSSQATNWVHLTKIAISNLQDQIYILTIIDKDSKTTNKKIINCP